MAGLVQDKPGHDEKPKERVEASSLLFEHDDLPHPDPVAQPIKALVDLVELQAIGEKLGIAVTDCGDSRLR